MKSVVLRLVMLAEGVLLLGAGIILSMLVGRWLPYAGELAFVMDEGGRRSIHALDIGRGLTFKLADNAADPLWSPDGTKLAYVSTDRTLDLYVVNADGSGRRNLTQHPARDDTPAWSPDSQRLAFVSSRVGSEEIFIINADGGGLHNLTQHPATDHYPSWSPDGHRIIFISWYRGGRSQVDVFSIAVEAADRAATVEQLTHIVFGGFDAALPLTPTWLPDGAHFAFRQVERFNSVVYVQDAAGELNNVLEDEYVDAMPVWSPDGQYAAFTKQGRNVYLLDMQTETITNLTKDSANSNLMPSWSPDGLSLAFVSYRNGRPGIYKVDQRGERIEEIASFRALVVTPAWRPGVY